MLREPCLDALNGCVTAREWSPGSQALAILMPFSTQTETPEPSKSEARRYHARSVRMVVKANRTQLEKIAALIAEGRVKVSIDKVFSLKEAAAAHAYLEKGHVRGKVLLHVPHSWIDPDPTEPKLSMTQQQELAFYSGTGVTGVGPLF